MEIQGIGAAWEAQTVYSVECIEAINALMDKYGAKVVADSLQVALTHKVYHLQAEVNKLQRDSGIEFSGQKVI